jgi:hypothetical protein
LVREAVRDAKALREAAVAAAKDKIIEAMVPGIRALVERNISDTLDEKRSMSQRTQGGNQRADYFPAVTRQKHAKFEEEKEPKGEDPMADVKKNQKQEDEGLSLEALAGMFPGISEEPEAREEEDEAAGAGMGVPTLGEEPAPLDIPGMEDEARGKKDDDMDGEEPVPVEEPPAEEEDEAMKHSEEEDEGVAIRAEAKGEEEEEDEGVKRESVEISEAELKKVYQQAFLDEVKVSKDFKDMSKFVDFEDQKADGAGITPDKKGEHPWNDEKSLDHQDHIPEGVRRAIKAGVAENAQLRESLRKAVHLVKQLGTRLHEVNLFNAKVLHVNRILNKSGPLSRDQKQVAMESIDKARSIEEVRIVYETVVKSFAAAGRINESRKPAANAQRARKSGGADPKVIRESVDKNAGKEQFGRMQLLAGLVK